MRTGRWPDERLPCFAAMTCAPLSGLVHHGSGPRHTSLVDPEFPAKLAQYASAVAQRYPWVDAYTPVNEPLTTARFSGLYGHWYPHGQDDRTFVRALLNQCRGTVLAMRAIRSVNSGAVLIQTDDLGARFQHSSPALSGGDGESASLAYLRPAVRQPWTSIIRSGVTWSIADALIRRIAVVSR